MKRFVLIICLAAFSTVVYAQTVRTSRGKEFYGMVMKNSGASTGENTLPYFRVFLSCPVAADASVGITDGSWDTSVAIIPNVVATVELPMSVEDTDNETPEYKAIHIVADTDISVYIIYHKIFSSDSYMALPVTSLGNEYTAVCYSSCTTFGDNKAPEFGIIATQDSTEVAITPSSTTLAQHSVGVPFNVTLNKGETYLVCGDPNDDASDLTGSSVVATKPIAFLSGHDRTEIVHDSGQSRNCLVEQIPANNMLGTSFITVPYAGRPYPVDDYFRVVAPKDNTSILLNGVVAATINAGQFYEFHAQKPMQIQTNNPVILAQYSQSETDNTGQYIGANPGEYLSYGWDPTMMLVSSTEEFMNDYIIVNSVDAAFTANYVNIVIPDSAVSSLLLDGSNVSAPFLQITGSGFSYAQVPVSQGSHHIEASEPFGVYVYGIGPADAYANMGSAAFKVLTDIHTTVSNPAAYSLGPIAPNPVADQAQINYSIGASGHVRITLHDMLGREVSRIVDGER
ncbi:MAG TPA: IgGFc-binding protein, partial [Candidatus Kapabacteria bacterium]|nr:IgGFc-binding protein [Candidatus Kapabacteria bacterium]